MFTIIGAPCRALSSKGKSDFLYTALARPRRLREEYKSDGAARATHRRQDKPALRFASGHLLISGRSLRQWDDAIDQRSLERAPLEDGGEGVEQRSRRDGVALARVDPEQLAFIVEEIDKVEADPAVAR